MKSSTWDTNPQTVISLLLLILMSCGFVFAQEPMRIPAHCVKTMVDFFIERGVASLERDYYQLLQRGILVLPGGCSVSVGAEADIIVPIKAIKDVGLTLIPRKSSGNFDDLRASIATFQATGCATFAGWTACEMEE